MVGSLSWRSLTRIDILRAKWLQWPFSTNFSSSEVALEALLFAALSAGSKTYLL